MAKLRGLDDVKKDILTEALSQAIQWIDSGDLDLAKSTLIAMIDLYGNKILKDGNNIGAQKGLDATT